MLPHCTSLLMMRVRDHAPSNPSDKAANRRAFVQSRKPQAPLLGDGGLSLGVLSYPRASKTPRAIWHVLQGIILSHARRKSGALYASIWNREKNESPLRPLRFSQQACSGVAGKENVVVDLAMRYGILRSQSGSARGPIGMLRILLSRYRIPRDHHGDVTTRRSLLTPCAGSPPSARAAYYDDPVYIDALAASVGRFSRPSNRSVVLIAPSTVFQRLTSTRRSLSLHCQKTTRLLLAAVFIKDVSHDVQSRFGPRMLSPTPTRGRAPRRRLFEADRDRNPGFVSVA